MYTSRRDRLRRDYEIMRHSALIHEGRKHSGLILYGPIRVKALGVLCVAAGAWWAWSTLDRDVVAATVGGVGVVLALVYALQISVGSTMQRRMIRRARGGAGGPRHAVGAAGVCLILAAVLMAPGGPW